MSYLKMDSSLQGRLQLAGLQPEWQPPCHIKSDYVHFQRSAGLSHASPLLKDRGSSVKISNCLLCLDGHKLAMLTCLEAQIAVNRTKVLKPRTTDCCKAL